MSADKNYVCPPTPTCLSVAFKSPRASLTDYSTTQERRIGHQERETQAAHNPTNQGKPSKYNTNTNTKYTATSKNDYSLNLGLVLSKSTPFWTKTSTLLDGLKMVFQDPKDPTTVELVLIKFMDVTLSRPITELASTPVSTFLEPTLKSCQLR